MSLQESPVLLRRNATCLIDVAAYSRVGLDAAAFDVAPGRRGPFGLRGVEGVGGKLVLTSTALWFHPHRLNFTRAEFGIPLDEITEVRDVSRGLRRQIEVVMRNGARPRFVVWGIPALIAAIDRARGTSATSLR
ncbi:hypothetical protein [Curtobacterium sp. VKM Ac-2922]|uniref:hypothetical protein n=1 Tax=Curtobacterium sp. VKM Ac-2922 TaxID=2929475 RepID=UPI001FB1A799|nr:hypothetical protein [Curtobacterium sp. VKM Ac-2922]MCJ1715399.1 hypothetical protein [Curtobacterium sp. VKM Ac-2922]